MVIKSLLKDHVLVKPYPAEEKTKGGIIIPGTAKEDDNLKGTVLAVGPGTKDEVMEVKVNDDVFFRKWGSVELNAGDEKHYIIKQSDIYCILNKEEE